MGRQICPQNGVVFCTEWSIGSFDSFVVFAQTTDFLSFIALLPRAELASAVHI